MTGLIAIDESGDLGSAGKRYFSIAAIVMLRPRDLKKAADFIPKDKIEHRWNNSLPGIRKELLSIMSDLRFNVVILWLTRTIHQTRDQFMEMPSIRLF